MTCKKAKSKKIKIFPNAKYKKIKVLPKKVKALRELNRALKKGIECARPAGIKVESLAREAKSLLRSKQAEERWPFFRSIPKNPALSTVEVFVDSHGRQRTELVKYISGVTSMSLQMMEACPETYPDQLKRVVGVVMDIAEKALFWGDSTKDYNIPKGAGFACEGEVGESLDGPIGYLGPHNPVCKEWAGLWQWVRDQRCYSADLCSIDSVKDLIRRFRRERKSKPTDIFLPADALAPLCRGNLLPKTVDGVRLHTSRYLEHDAFIGVMRPEVIQFRQLAPFMRLDLAITDPTRRTMVMLFGTPIVIDSSKWARFELPHQDAWPR